MKRLYLIIVVFVIALSGCSDDNFVVDGSDASYDTSLADSLKVGRGGLLLSRFNSLSELKSVVHIEYHKGFWKTGSIAMARPQVHVTHKSQGRGVKSVLTTGISEEDFINAKNGTFLDRVWLAVRSPYAAYHREDLLRVELLGRNRPFMFGEGDVAFYSIADLMVQNITHSDSLQSSIRDFSEKGFLNSFNHILAQAMMTSIFSEEFAGFIAGVHERYTIPELITGNFSEDQLYDIDNGAVDNYVDVINNEWGQELGKRLQQKYNINRSTNWTPELLANYLNDIQAYCSWAFQVGFEPFKPTDVKMNRFSVKVNKVMGDVTEYKKFYY